MKVLPFLFMFLLSLLLLPSASAVRPKAIEREVNSVTLNEFLVSPKKSLKKKLGRKLTFHENIALWVLKRPLKRMVKKEPKLGEVSINRFFGNNQPGAGALQENNNPSASLAIAAFVASILLPLLGGLLCIVALGAIAKHPEKFKGKGWAWAGILVTIIYLVGIIAIAALLY